MRALDEQEEKELAHVYGGNEHASFSHGTTY